MSKPIFIDTNIFVEIFARSGDKSERAKNLLESDYSLTTNMLVISELEWVLRYAYKLGRTKICVYLRFVLTSNIEIKNKKLLLEVLEYYTAHTVDWTDCLNMFLIKDLGGDQIYSYDRDLKLYPWIKRLEP